MSLSLHQQLRQTQKLIMTPQMQQSIQLLQLNSLELEQMISQEMMENPFLELVDDEESLRSQSADDAAAAAPEAPLEVEDTGLSDQAREELLRTRDDFDEPQVDNYMPTSEANLGSPEEYAAAPPSAEETVPANDFETFQQNDMDWDSEYRDSDTSAYANTREDVEEHDFTTYTALNENLYDHLVRQLRLSVLEGREFEIGEFIIGNLDTAGYLDCSLENQAKMLGYPPDLIELKGNSHSDHTLRRLVAKFLGKEAAERAKEQNRRQLVAVIVGHLIGLSADEAMAMSRNEWLLALIARRMKRPVQEIAGMKPEELVLETVAKRLRTEPQTVFDVLEVIQEFEPTGVGARTLAECLKLQCEERGIRNRVLYRVLDDHLEDLQQKRFREISKAISVPEAEIMEVFHIISHLDPRPGQSMTRDTPRYITPDVYVKKIDDKYMYFLNEGDAGRLRIASNYRRMMQSRRSNMIPGGTPPVNGTAVAVATAPTPSVASEPNSYAQEKYKNAVWLIKNIEKRKSTVLRVTEAIMNYQKDFLEKGIEYLHPLTLRNIAEVVGMHESTIARVTTHKYVETPRGIFELKFFFSSGLETDSGEDASSRSIKEIITQMITAEDPKKPLSDQKIADMLRDKGIQIARRTVAKYREQLKILPAKLRKSVN